MKRIFSAILSVISVCFAFGRIPGATARAVGETAFPIANAEESASDELFLPGSYEQYLPLTAPCGAAVSDDYTAIADGGKIYVYSRASGAYDVYLHDCDVAQLSFSDDGILYFLDKATSLNRLNPANLSAGADESLNVHCSSFVLSGETVFFTTVSGGTAQIWQRSFSSSSAQAIVENVSFEPALALDGDVLYYTYGGIYLYKYGDDSFERRLLPPLSAGKIFSTAFCGGFLYYTDSEKRLYACDLSAADSEILSFEGEGYTSLSSHGGSLYVVCENAVRRLRPDSDGGAFTDYEIGASSSSPARLSGASASALVGNTLLVADTGNRRLTIVDTTDGSCATIDADFDATMVASDGETALLADESTAKIYSLSDRSLIAEFPNAFQSLSAVAAAYGKYYFVSNGNSYRVAARDANGEWTLGAGITRPSSYPARLLCSDVYGNLYVACTDGGVYRYTEEQFSDGTFAGKKYASVRTDARQILVDYAGTLYALGQNTLYAGETGQTAYSLEKNLVCSRTSEPTVTSVAFGVESGAAYYLYDGDFIVRTYDLPLPTLTAIPVNDCAEEIFSETEPTFSVVETQIGALFIRFDLERLDSASCFPYLSYDRETQSRTAIRLSETDGYSVVAVFDERTKNYTTALVLSDFCREIPRSEFLLPADDFENGVGYVTNAVSLYKYPYLSDLLTVTTIGKNAPVTVLGKIDELDYGYYYVSVVAADGTSVTGYLPQAYVSEFNASPPETQFKEFGGEKTDPDAIRRLIFLLLGGAIICVLADYLILKKKK